VRDRETTIKTRQEREKLKTFDLVTQKQDRSEQLQQELKHEQKND
jgi:hypothetical protein